MEIRADQWRSGEIRGARRRQLEQRIDEGGRSGEIRGDQGDQGGSGEIREIRGTLSSGSTRVGNQGRSGEIRGDQGGSGGIRGDQRHLEQRIYEGGPEDLADAPRLDVEVGLHLEMGGRCDGDRGGDAMEIGRRCDGDRAEMRWSDGDGAVMR